MANLGPLYQNQTYSNLLQIDGGLSADLKKVLDGDGNESGLSLSFTAASITGLVSESANNLYGGAAGTIPYQSSSNNTAFTTAGPVGYVLSSNGTLPPTWVNTIPFSSFAAQATNIGGGGLGQLPYQADLNSTSFVPAGTPGQVLVSGGLSAPFWSNSVPAAGTAGTANAVLGGVAGNLLYQSGVNTTSYVTNGLNGQYLRSQGALAPIWDTLTAGDVGAVAADGSIAMTGALNLGSNRILNVAPPAIGTDGANKDYVDAAATGLKIKTACRAATTANITLSGLQTVDGVALNNLDRVLVKEQGAPATNGIYLAVSGGPWTRTADADTWSELYGATVFITNGTVNANSTWAATIPSSGVLGVDEIRFALFGASASYTAGTGLNLIGSQFSLATPVTVSNGGIGVSTITGILKGNGTSAISTANAADIVGVIGATTVQNATTAVTCTGNAGSATVLATARTINGVAFNGSANITIEAGTPNTLSFSASGAGISPGGSWRGLTDVTVSYNSIGAAARDGSNATSVTPWNINIGGVASGLTAGVILPATQGGTGYGTGSPYTAGSLLYASTPTNIGQINPLATNNRVLLSGSTPAWGRVALATDMVDGVLPVTRGGTGNNVTYLGNAAIYTNPTGDTLISGLLPVASGGTGANNAAQARFNLGGTILGGNLFTIPNQAAVTFPRFNADNTVSALSALDFRAAIGAGTGTGTVTSVGLSAPVGLTVSSSPVTASGTLALTYTAGYSIPTTAKQAEWDAAFTQRLQWDGGATNLVAATGRASLGLGNIATINTTGSTTNFLRADGTWQAPASSMYVTVAGFTTADINTALASAGFGGTIFLPAGTYSITSTINIQDRNVIGAGFNTILQGVSASLGAGNPMFVLSGIVTIKSLRAQFDVKPATATAGQYVIFRAGNGSYPLQRYSNIDSVWTYYCGTAFWNPTGLGSVFSTTFSNLRVEFFTYRGFDFNGTDRTGNIYSNIYLAAGIPFTQSNTSQTISTGSKTFTTTLAPNTTDFSVGQIVTVAQQTNALNAMYGAVTSKTTNTITVNVTSVIGSGSSAAWDITTRNTCNAIFALSGNESECVISQINPEHSLFTQAAVIFDGVNALSANAIHLEQVTPTANNLPFIYTNASSGVISALTFLGNWYPRYPVPTTTGNSIFQCNSSYNTYGGTNNTLTANYFNIGEFYIANSATTLSWTMFARGTDNGPMYIAVGGYQYTPNDNYYAAFPTSGNLTFLDQGQNANFGSPDRTTVGTQRFINNVFSAYSGTIVTSQRQTDGTHYGFLSPTGVLAGQIFTVGTSTTYATSSDYRLKSQVEPLSNGAETILALRPKKFLMEGMAYKIGGFLAHEVQDIMPEAVIGEKDAVDEDGIPIYQGMDATKFIPSIVDALQQILSRLDALENANNG
jgi:hypothetical protein